MADHWRTPHHEEQSGCIWPWIAGAITGPLVALLFVVVVIWIAGRWA